MRQLTVEVVPVLTEEAIGGFVAKNLAIDQVRDINECRGLVTLVEAEIKLQVAE